MKTISQIREMRERAGISQYELSNLADVPRDRLSRFECGYLELCVDEQSRIERALEEALRGQARRISEALSHLVTQIAALRPNQG
jgi:predicted transcriptional regulator